MLGVPSGLTQVRDQVVAHGEAVREIRAVLTWWFHPPIVRRSPDNVAFIRNQAASVGLRIDGPLDNFECGLNELLKFSPLGSIHDELLDIAKSLETRVRRCPYTLADLNANQFAHELPSIAEDSSPARAFEIMYLHNSPCAPVAKTPNKMGDDRRYYSGVVTQSVLTRSLLSPSKKTDVKSLIIEPKRYPLDTTVPAAYSEGCASRIWVGKW
jgi:hypothetical protein